jgi:hypothetical protein
MVREVDLCGQLSEWQGRGESGNALQYLYLCTVFYCGWKTLECAGLAVWLRCILNFFGVPFDIIDAASNGLDLAGGAATAAGERNREGDQQGAETELHQGIVAKGEAQNGLGWGVGVPCWRVGFVWYPCRGAFVCV